jgi:hypothetical protein
MRSEKLRLDAEPANLVDDPALVPEGNISITKKSSFIGLQI